MNNTKKATQPLELVLPFPSIDNYQIATQVASDKAYKKGGRFYYRIHPSRIVVRFNIREDLGDIIGLANSMLKSGQQIPCKGVPLANGGFLLIDGHRRYEAVLLLHKWGYKHFTLKCEALEKETTEIEHIKLMFITQDNKHLTDNEVGKCFKILVDNGWSQKQIADDLGKTPAYVNQMLKYNEEAPEVKELVAAGNLSAHTVVKLQGKIPNQAERTEAIKEAVTRKTTLVKSLKEIAAPLLEQHNDDIEVQETDNDNTGSTLEAGEEVDRFANYKSTSKKEIDTIENASGPAIVQPVHVSVNDIMGKKSKRERMNLLVEGLDEKFKLKLDEEGKKDLFDFVCEFC